jgi:hypothetical protein
MTLNTLLKSTIVSTMNTKQKPALIGRDDGGSTYTQTVLGGLGYIYIRVQQGDQITISQALNPYGFTLTDNGAVWIDYDPGGRAYIARKRYEG